jgi:hypothetical protein
VGVLAHSAHYLPRQDIVRGRAGPVENEACLFLVLYLASWLASNACIIQVSCFQLQ